MGIPNGGREREWISPQKTMFALGEPILLVSQFPSSQFPSFSFAPAQFLPLLYPQMLCLPSLLIPSLLCPPSSHLIAFAQLLARPTSLPHNCSAQTCMVYICSVPILLYISIGCAKSECVRSRCIKRSSAHPPTNPTSSKLYS